MQETRRAPMPWKVVVAIVAGMSLVTWAVEDLLSWMQRAALVFGVLLLAYGVVAGGGRDRRADGVPES